MLIHPALGVILVVLITLLDADVLSPRGHSIRGYAFNAVIRSYIQIQAQTDGTSNDTLDDFSQGGPMF
jgi:hypothetical protein